MITNSYDNSKPLIEPSKFYQKGQIADKCIVTFSYKVVDYVKQNYNLVVETKVGSANGDILIYSFTKNEEKILFYMSPIGSNVAGTMLDEISYVTGATKFIFFGSCGILTEDCCNKIIVPTKAYRDEGFSYHYLEASDYIDIKNAKCLKNILERKNIAYISGKTWTTDAIYRETINNVNKRKADGCICVEMEAAGLEAICNYRNLDLFIFFVSGDILYKKEWEKGSGEKNKQQNAFDIALMLTKEI